ncbi:hypothetical protein EJB05_13228, partial [Eragrostis curvula]
MGPISDPPRPTCGSLKATDLPRVTELRAPLSASPLHSVATPTLLLLDQQAAGQWAPPARLPPLRLRRAAGGAARRCRRRPSDPHLRLPLHAGAIALVRGQDSLVHCVQPIQEMSASEIQADEASKANVRKVGQAGLKIRIRLPPRKKLSDGTGVPEDSENLTAKNVPDQTGNSTLSTTCTAAEVKVEASSNLPGVPEDAKNLSSKKVPEQADNNTGLTAFMVSKEKVEEACSSRPGEELCKEVNSNNQSETLSSETPPEKANFIAPSKNLGTVSGVLGKEESSYQVIKRLCEEEGNENILNKGLSPENSCSTPVNESCVGATDKISTKNLAITGVNGEVENYSGMGPSEDASNNALSNRVLYETNSNTAGKDLPVEVTINCPSKNLTTSAVKCEKVNDNPVGNSLFEVRKMSQGKDQLPAKAQNNVSRKRPAVPANDKTSKKKLRGSVLHGTDTCKNTSGTKPFPSVGQAVEPSTSAANLEAIKVYKEFEEKVRRTVYLDNLSHLATEAVIKVALNQFGTVRTVNFLVNYTVPYDIPQSALVEMETEKDAASVVSMLHEFPFMMCGMPRPVRGKRATAVMFNDRPRKPGSKLEFHWVGPTDPDYQNVRKFKLMAKRHEVENLALIRHELEGEELLGKQQQDDLNCNYRKLEAVDAVVMTGWVNRLAQIYNMRFNESF